MKKLHLTVAAVALSGTLLAAPSDAQARNGAIALGIVGGIAAAALVGSALASPYYGYASYPYYNSYYYPRAYYGYAPAYAYYPTTYRRTYAYYPPYYASAAYPTCYWMRRSVWDPWWGWRVVRTRVCS